MCGRVHQNGPDLPGISSEMDASEEELARAYKENRNGSPGEWFWIIRRHPGHGRNVHTPMRWGVLPSWLKDTSGWRYPSNARRETVKTNGAFKLPYRRKRCLLPIQLFYEWQKILEDGAPLKKGHRKQPYAIAMKDRRPFAVAGLYEAWTDPATGQQTNTFTVVTCEANSLIATIHDRMPVILAADNYERWIACIEPDPDDLMVPYPSDLMDIWPISTKVNSPSYKAADVADPIDVPVTPPEPAGRQPDLFWERQMSTQGETSRPWPVIKRGGHLKLRQMPRPHHPATVLPGDPPELAPGESPGLGAFVLDVSFTSIRLRIEDRIFTLQPHEGKLGTLWKIA